MLCSNVLYDISGVSKFSFFPRGQQHLLVVHTLTGIQRGPPLGNHLRFQLLHGNYNRKLSKSTFGPSVIPMKLLTKSVWYVIIFFYIIYFKNT